MSPGLPLHRLATAGEEFPLAGDQRVELVAVEGELGRGTDEALVQPDDPDEPWYSPTTRTIGPSVSA